MEEEFDKILAQKMRELLDYEEPYQKGAWENFQDKRDRKKRRMWIWYFRGSVAAITILLALGLFLGKGKDSNFPDDNGITDTKEQNRGPMDGTERTGRENEKTTFLDGTTLTGREPEHRVKDDTVENGDSNKDDNPNDPKVDYAARGVSLDPKDADATTNVKEVASAKPMYRLGAQGHGDVKERENNQDILKNKEALKRTVPSLEGDPGKTLEQQDSVTTSEQELIADNLIGPDPGPDDDETAKGARVDRLRLGVLLSPSVGSGGKQSVASSGLGVGLEMEVPVPGSKFSMSTGVVFNALYFDSDRTMTGLFLDEEETANRKETELYGLDIPLNMTYRISDRVSLKTGVSSYIILKESTDMTETFDREVEVFQSIDGNLVRYTTTELVSVKETTEAKNIRFAPLGTINLSIGYRVPLTPGLNFEIQPFYKYPLRSLSVRENSTHTVGVALKVILID